MLCQRSERRAVYQTRHGRARPGHPRLFLSPKRTWITETSPGMTENYECLARSFRRTHLDRAGGGAAIARGVVHILDIGLRQHVFARRYRAHHIGHREYRLVVGGAIDGGREAVVAEFGILGLLAILDPVQRAGVTG